MSITFNLTPKMSQQMLNAILDTAASALILVNQKGIVLYANKAVEELFGLTVEELNGKHLNKLLLPTTRQKHQELFSRFFTQTFNRDMGDGASFPAQHKSGKIIHVSIGLRPIKLGKEQCVLATITKAKRLNDATTSLARSNDNLATRINVNKRLREVAENSSDAVFILDHLAKITWINRTAASLMSSRLSELVDTEILQLIDDTTKSSDRRKFKDALCDNLSFSGDLTFKQANDKPILVNVTLQPVFENSMLQGFTVWAKDVTSRRQLEEQMRENNELLETTARIAKLGFYSLDIVSDVLTWSEEVYNIHELPVNSDISAEDAIKFYAPEARSAIHAVVDRCMKTGQSFDLELPFITAKNRRIWVRSVGYAEFKNGQPVKLKGAFQDITYLRKTAFEAEQAAQAKSNFLANMSHELRTPISGILGITELMTSTNMDKKQSEYLNMVSKSANSLLFLVNQVLDYAKLDSGLQTLNKVAFNLHQLVTDKTYIHILAAKGKGCKFVVEFQDDVEAHCFGDSHRLGQVLNNLCSNAVKFTDEGEIHLNVEHLPNALLKFTVKDSGVGIQSDDIKRLFHEFQQVDSSYSRPHQGTGLGLTISKQLVSLMGGEIGVESEFGKGSSFWFTLPIPIEKHSALEILEDITLPNTLLMCADDVTCKTFNEIAHKQRLKIKACKDIASIIRALKQNKQWDLVVMLGYVDDMPLDICIASVQRLMHEKQYLLVNEYLLNDSLNVDKPNTLLLALNNHTQELTLEEHSYWQFVELQKWYSSFANLSEKKNNLLGKHVLVAEDNSINQVLFSEMVKDSGAKIKIVENGQEALNYLDANPSVDLVVMDCQMPIMDGFEASRLIRAHNSSAISEVRIAAATAHGFEEDIQACFNAGMNDVLIKPFTKEQLLEMIYRNI